MTERYGFGPGFGQTGRDDAEGQRFGPSPDFPAYAAGPGGTAYHRPEPGTRHDESVGGGFGALDAGARIDADAFGRPPLMWLASAAVVALAALCTAVLFGSAIVLAGAAWAAAGPVAIGLLAVYSHRDTQQRARAVYDELPQARVGYWAVSAVALAGTLASAWQIAQWVGRL